MPNHVTPQTSPTVKPKLNRDDNIAIVFLTCVILILVFCPASRPYGILRDFNAFYCAGESVRTGQDPYLAEPLGTCERKTKPKIFQAGQANLTLPAPLPPYDLLFLAQISRLPYVTAAFFWTVGLLIAYAATTWLIADMARIRITTVAIVLAPTVAYGCAVMGEIMPITLAGLAIAAWMQSHNKPMTATTGAILAMTSPHVGLPTATALFLYSPKTRIPLLISAVILIATCIATVGPTITLEYFANVLPAHALSEVASTSQMSLTAVAHAVRLPDQTAAYIGTISYFAMFALAVATARRLWTQNPHDPLIVLAPATIILLGGVFLHVTQMAAALPCALIMHSRATIWTRRAIATGAAMIAVPWVQFEFLGTILAVVGGATIATTYSTMFVRKRRDLAACGMGILTFAFIIGLNIAVVVSGTTPHQTLPDLNPADLAEVGWKINIDSIKTDDWTIFDIARMPSWIGILIVTTTLVLGTKSSKETKETS